MGMRTPISSPALAIATALILGVVASCSRSGVKQKPGIDESAAASRTHTVDKTRRELEARYRQNEAAFFARDPDRVMLLRHPQFHTILPDGKVNTREEMYERTRSFINRVERFDSLSENITGLTVNGDTAHAVVAQRTVRKQRLPDGTLHEIRTSVVQRESWIWTTAGWLMWRVDQIKPGPTLVDGTPLEKKQP